MNRSMLAAMAVLVGSGATILGAWGFEHIGNLPPCPLCYTQRYFHYAAIPLALVLILFARGADRASVMRWGLLLCAAILVAGAGVAGYHAGVEYKWWEGPDTCAAGAGLSEESVLPDLNNLNVVRCDEPAWTLFGLSLAGYNVILSLALAAIAVWGAADRKTT